MNENQAHAPVPDQRLDQIMEDLRRLREENRTLRGTIDHMANQTAQSQKPQTQDQSDFQPHIDKALEKKFQQLMKPVLEQQSQAHNYFADRDDLLMFTQRYGIENYEKNKDKIESLRAERRQIGQPLTREDAYRFVAFEEQGKKPKLNPEPAQVKQPVFDPYLKKYVTPEEQQQPQTGVQQVTQTQNPTPPAPQQRDDNVTLPPVGATPPATKGAVAPLPNIELGADEKALDAWADKYGDQQI